MAKVITLSTTKTKKAEQHKTDTLELSGHEKTVSALAKAKVAAAKAKQRMEKARAVLEPVAKAKQRDAEIGGQFTRAVTFNGLEERATFSFTNAFASLDPGCRMPLTDAIGPKFDELFETVDTVGVRTGAIEQLRNAVIKSGQDPADYFETKRVLRPVDDFRKCRFDARASLTDAQNDALDEVVDQLAAKPSMSVK